MNYKYIADNSEQCRNLEERMKRFDEHFVIHFLNQSSGLIISDDKIRGEMEKADNATNIKPDEYSEIKMVGLKKIRDNAESRIFMVDEDNLYALIGNSFYQIRYKSEKKQ